MSTAFKKRSRPANTRNKSDTPLVAKASESEEVDTVDEAGAGGEDDQPTQSLQEIMLMRKYGKTQAGIDLHKLNAGEQKKRKKKVKEGEEDGGGEESYGLKKGKGVATGEEEDEADDAETKTRRLVKSNNFTQQTNALDVDKHMMAYIEAELLKRRGGKSEEEVIKEQGGSYDPQEELYRIAEKYRIEKKIAVEEEEGNVTTSMGMLTSIPEVDLGMEIRLKNITDTEKAKREMLEQKRLAAGQQMSEADESFAAARFYRPNYKIQSDADALEDARREAMNLPPQNRRRNDKTETATDDQVYERFKKRIRKN